MMKKALAILLASALFFAMVPSVFASGFDDGWRIFYREIAENTFAAVIVAPAAYTRVSDTPQVETIFTADHTESSVSTPAAERILYSSEGATESRWALTVTYTLPDESVTAYSFAFAVLPLSVLDAAGNGNARVLLDDDLVFLPAGGYTGIDVFSGLLLQDYPSAADTVAVGDTLRVEYSGLDPIEICLNGEPVAAFPGGDLQRYACPVTETGTLTVVVRQDGAEIGERTMTVITSKEMYERNLRDGLITGEDIPGTADLIDVGVPKGSPFIVAAKIIALFNALRIFFQRLFSFTRITK